MGPANHDKGATHTDEQRMRNEPEHRASPFVIGDKHGVRLANGIEAMAENLTRYLVPFENILSRH
jgi:hypothetical protein